MVTEGAEFAPYRRGPSDDKYEMWATVFVTLGIIFAPNLFLTALFLGQIYYWQLHTEIVYTCMYFIGKDNM